jgi:hypothetical protein
MTPPKFAPPPDWSWPAHLHRKFESDPPHDPNPERRYSPEMQAQMRADIARQLALIRVWKWMRGDALFSPQPARSVNLARSDSAPLAPPVDLYVFRGTCPS